MSGTVQLSLADASTSDARETARLKQAALQLLREHDTMGPTRGIFYTFGGTTTPYLAAQRVYQNPGQEGAADRLAWARRVTLAWERTQEAGR